MTAIKLNVRVPHTLTMAINGCYQSVNDNSRIKASVLYLQQLKSKANVCISTKCVKKLLLKMLLLSFSYNQTGCEAFGP